MLGSTVLRAARGIHRRMYDTQIVLTNGATVRVRLPYKRDPVKLNEDIYNTAPWVEHATVVDTSGQLSKFARRFEGREGGFQIPGGRKGGKARK